MTSHSEPVSYFHRIFDVAVYGSGYAAFAAAMRLHQAGRRVVMVNRSADTLWESGRSFAAETGQLDAPEWRAWIGELSQRGAMAGDGRIDGAIVEVVATWLIRDRKLPVLYYVAPLAVELAGGAVEAVLFSTKGGLRRLMARQWIDASETGELFRLVDRSVLARQPDALVWRALHQHHAWVDVRDRDLPPSDGATSLHWHAGIWPGERCLTVTLPGTTQFPRRAIVPALTALREAMPEVLAGAVLSHCTVDPLPIYRAVDSRAVSPTATNLIGAAPAMVDAPVMTLADRFALGLAAVEGLSRRAVHECDPSLLHRPIDATAVTPVEVIESDVVVAGAGTGGAMAAIAAGRSGARVTCIEPMSFVGGIGSGGGIHYYWYGVNGGLQEEVDQRVVKLMLLFGTKAQVFGFHPDAKKLVLEQMLDEAGVQVLPHTMLCSVRHGDHRVTSALVANARGPVELRASAWIDATGDGDLSAMAGASFTLGRDGDGSIHAFSQSSGRLQKTEKFVRMIGVNYDAGWVDPTDSQDLTRGRLVGVSQYLCDPWTPTYTADDRPTYIAPAIGLRQARQIETDYTLTLADLIERRQFRDAIGFTGAHYDNHSVDYEFESDEAVFWVWVCRQWSRGRTACQMPYGMIVPRDLDNVWLACRAFGVSPDAHFSCRMQRDIQRVGEAAGYAAALAVQHKADARTVPLDELQRALAATGAIDLKLADVDRDFGPISPSNTFDHPAHEAAIRQGLDDLRTGKPSINIWYVYRAGDTVRDEVVQCLTAANPMVSWLAAGLLSAWGDCRAESRLLHAISVREYGFDDVPEGERPERNRYMVPHWLSAITLLRTCGTGRSVAAFRVLADDRSQPLNVRTAIVITLRRLVERGVELDRAEVQDILDALLVEPIPGRFVAPQRSIAGTLNGEDFGIQPTAEDHGWQLHLAVAKARLALGLDAQDVTQFFQDERLLVRRVFAQLRPRDTKGDASSKTCVHLG